MLQLHPAPKKAVKMKMAVQRASRHANGFKGRDGEGSSRLSPVIGCFFVAGVSICRLIWFFVTTVARSRVGSCCIIRTLNRQNCRCAPHSTKSRSVVYDPDDKDDNEDKMLKGPSTVQMGILR
mmetsp:Transcript_48445/g.97474  ORF Transcript_48445/g.97474 Transcript_48445/m.97474 type:complete len:123 (+) Transcript_48445:704-1072(+)